MSLYTLKILTFLVSMNIGTIGTATTFSAVDTWNPDPGLACYHGRTLNDQELVVAHPTLPCRSKVIIYNLRTRRWVQAKVGDRGPRHAAIDLSPATAKAIKSNGMETVYFYSLTN